MAVTTDVFLRNTQLTGLLEIICQELELTETQAGLAAQRYTTVGEWLADSPSSVLQEAKIYPQGSIALLTTVRPLSRNEFDLDLVCTIPGGQVLGPKGLKDILGRRLKEHAVYAEMLEEKCRCWRLNYAGEFHLDITPSVPDLRLSGTAEFVPDRELRAWKPTDPRGYRSWFEKLSSLHPRVLLEEASFASAKAEVEALPGPSKFKGVLRRCVQLFKRHRDVMFEKSPGVEPISIILTTLTARSYAKAFASGVFETELDLLLAVLAALPSFIERRLVGGVLYYFVPNETNANENFADKWNQDPRLPNAFEQWHRQALVDFANFAEGGGLDTVGLRLDRAFGESVTRQALSRLTQEVEAARASKVLHALPSTGLSIASGLGPVVRKNTFFGR